MKKIYDLGLAWCWEFDLEFVRGIERECLQLGLTVFLVEPHNVNDTISKIRSRRISFRTFLDRASDDDDKFIPLAKLLTSSAAHIFNKYKHVKIAKDKAIMHLALLGEGIYIPYTIIISPYNKHKEIELSLTELAHLGRPFIIKPANTTGGGIGVVLGAETLKEIIETRQRNKNDKYLLQETIRPVILDDKKAWFRVFYAFGITISCWWDHETHIYQILNETEETKFHLEKLKTIVTQIHKICHLDFFSSEIAYTIDGKFVVVDYVNEICDMREQSKHLDGVPDTAIKLIQQSLMLKIQSFSKQSA